MKTMMSDRPQGHRMEGRDQAGLARQAGHSGGGEEEKDIRSCRNELTVELADRLLLSFFLSLPEGDGHTCSWLT